MNADCTILVTSCDAYRDVERPFLALFRRYWPDCPFELVVNGETAAEPGFDRAVLCGKGKSWSEMLVEALDQITTPYVILLMNDYYLCDTVDTETVLGFVAAAKSERALSVRMVPEPAGAGPVRTVGNVRLQEFPKNTAYAVSCKATVWDRAFLRALAAKTKSAWEFERRGSFLFESCETRPLLVSPTRAFPFLDVVHKGYWEPYGVALLAREKVDYDFSRRGRAPLTLRLKEWIKGKIFHLAPDLVTRLQNRFQ